MNIHIENNRTAYANVAFGRALPALISVVALADLVSIIFTDLSDGTLIPALLSVLWVIYMGIAFARRGRHPAIREMKIGDEWISAKCVAESRSFRTADVTVVEYEGVVNRSRVPVAGAEFPQNGERILVLTLRDGMELRVKVGSELDPALKEFAVKLAAAA